MEDLKVKLVKKEQALEMFTIKKLRDDIIVVETFSIKHLSMFNEF